MVLLSAACWIAFPSGLLSEVFNIKEAPGKALCREIRHAGDQYKCTDLEAHAIDEDTSDFSPHQFIGPACEPMCNDDNEHPLVFRQRGYAVPKTISDPTKSSICFMMTRVSSMSMVISRFMP